MRALSALTFADRLPVDMQGVEALRARAARGDPKALEAAAREFEAMVMQMLLKAMRSTSLAGEDDPFGGTGMQLYRDLLDQHWAQRIASGPGLGFADAMLRAMRQREGASMPKGEGQPVRAGEVEVKVPPAEIDAPAASTSPLSPPPSLGDGTRAEFMRRMWPYAEAAAARIGVPVSFVLGHAGLESGWGRSEMRHPDGRASHNLFGIKAQAGWAGEFVETLTTEYRDGRAIKVVERFRAYPGYAEAFDDYVRLLQRRYPDAAFAGADPVRFAQGLVRGGYATDPRYAEKLVAVLAGLDRGPQVGRGAPV